MLSDGSAAVFEVCLRCLLSLQRLGTDPWAWIATKDGKRLNEHQVAQVPSTTDKNLVTRGFAEMTDGTEFEVCVKMIRNHRKEDNWRVNCWVDGRELECRGLWTPGQTTKFDAYHEEEAGVVYRRNLMFASVPTVEDRTAAIFTADGKQNLGTIKITLDRGTKLEGQGTLKLPPVTTPPVTSLLETDVKAKCSSFVGGGPSRVEYKAVRRYKFKTIKVGYHEFNISYLTTASMIIRNIIDDPSPQQKPFSKLQALPSEASANKRKRDTSDLTRMGREDGDETPGPSKKRRRTSSEVIELDDEPAPQELAISRKRIQFLEEQNKQLQARLQRRKYEEEKKVVDLTVEDDE